MTKMNYEYYIHYLGLERRNDRWVTEFHLNLDFDSIEKQLLLINNDFEVKNTLENNNREQ